MSPGKPDVDQELLSGQELGVERSIPTLQISEMEEILVLILRQIDEIVTILRTAGRPFRVKTPSSGSSDEAKLLLPVVNTGVKVA